MLFKMNYPLLIDIQIELINIRRIQYGFSRAIPPPKKNPHFLASCGFKSPNVHVPKV